MFGRNTDEQLVRSALDGSERAWSSIVKRYEKRLYNYSLRMVGNPDDAMDIMQDVFLSVYRNLAQFRGDGVFAAWLFRIASFRSTDYLRKRMRQFDSTDETDFADEHAVDTSSLDTNEGVMKLMQALPTEQRHVVELKFFQHFTFEEIAGQLGISSNTAKSRVYAALKKMRNQGEAALLLKSC